MCFLLWLSYDKTQGAKLIYIKYIEPYLNEHENQMDEILKTTQELVKNVEEMKQVTLVNETNEDKKEL